MNPSKILLVEDESAMRRFLRPTLESQGYQVVWAGLGEEALRLARTHNPDLVLLDLGLPDCDGLEVLKLLRSWNQRPILVISARDREADKVGALDLGADDYLTKPFGAPELLARVRAALRRSSVRNHPLGSVVFGPVCMDLSLRKVTRHGEPVRLTPIEYRLLEALVHKGGGVATHSHLLQEVWGPSREGQNHYLRIYMGHLRHKLEEDPAQPEFLITEPGVGYRLVLGS